MVIQELSKDQFFTNITERKNTGTFHLPFQPQGTKICGLLLPDEYPGSCLFCIFLCNRIFAFHTLLQDNLWDGGIKWLRSILPSLNLAHRHRKENYISFKVTQSSIILFLTSRLNLVTFFTDFLIQISESGLMFC